MLEAWCGEASELQPIVLTGAWRGRAPVDGLYGMTSALLFSASKMGADIQDELSYLDFPLPDSPFQLILIALEDDRMRALSGRDRHNCRINMYAALRDDLPGRLPPEHRGIFTLLMGVLLGIVYTDDTDAVTSACRETADYAENTLGFRMHVTISPSLRGVEKIETAYRMVQDAENSRGFYAALAEKVFVIPPDSLARITDRSQMMRFEQRFFQSVDQICGAVQAGDASAAGQYMKHQLQEILENSVGLPFPTALNLTINRFMSLLQYRLADQNLADWRYLAEMDFSRDLVSSPNLGVFLDRAQKIADELVEHARKRSEDAHDSQMHDIHRFIEMNATNINMSLSVVSREFRIKPRELAESFRQYFGESVGDVMHRARVKKAKELLLTTDDAVQDIAEKVGYCSLATMYRAFLKVEGVAPGKLRQNRES